MCLNTALLQIFAQKIETSGKFVEILLDYTQIKFDQVNILSYNGKQRKFDKTF